MLSLTTGNFINNDIYEFSYTAKDPTVNAIGLAAVRDFNAWLRYETADDYGNANPLAGDIQRIFTEVQSQPGRPAERLPHLGFNQAENGKKVFDGMMQWIAAGDGINLNYRWSQPGRTERNRQDHLFVEGVFPFSNVRTRPIRSRTRPTAATRVAPATNTCPLAGRDLLGQRVLGEGCVAAAHDARRQARSARLAVCAQLLHLEPPARRGQRDLEGRLPAVPGTRSIRRRSSVRSGSRSTNGPMAAARRRRAT